MNAPEGQYKPCPFCGRHKHSIVFWSDDDGEFEAVECNHCKASAPADVWNHRLGVVAVEEAP